MKVGDLVRVKKGTHDPHLPKDRTGIVTRLNTRRGGAHVFFPNRRTLKFHTDYLLVVAENA